jgi:hypothetical protein
VRGGEDFGLVEGTVGGDEDVETGGGECLDECSGWMVNIGFTLREGRRGNQGRERG